MKRLTSILVVGLIVLMATSAFASGSKFLADAVLEGGLTKLMTGTHVNWCTSVPANYAGIAAVTKANKTITAGAGNGNWTLADGDTSGRKATLGALSTITLTGNGTVITQCVDDGTTLLWCTPLSADKTIVDYTTETWTSAAVKCEIADITQ